MRARGGTRGRSGRMGEVEYRVHWKGYSAQQRSWLNAAELDGARRKVAEYEKKHKTKK